MFNLVSGATSGGIVYQDKDGTIKDIPIPYGSLLHNKNIDSIQGSPFIIYSSGGYSPQLIESAAGLLALDIPSKETIVGKMPISQDETNRTNITFIFPCLIAGTLITLADGTKKPVEYITYDDNLLVWDFFNGCFASAKPRWIKIRQTAEVYNKLTFDNGATLGLVGEGGTQGYHRIFNKQACCFTHTGVPETPDGTITFAEDKSEPVLVSQELVNDTVDFYNIITDKHFNLFANGILTSCKCSNMYRIEDMKYVGERLMSDEDIEADFAWRESLKLPK